MNLNHLYRLKSSRPIIWLDTESTATDQVPALSGVLIEGQLHTRVHDVGLAAAAREKQLEQLPFADFAQRLIRRARRDNALLGAYSVREYELLREASPADSEWLEGNYLNVVATRWFKNHLPAVHDELLRRAQAVSDFEKVGLKHFLRHPLVGYPYPLHLRGFSPAKAINRVRRQLEAKQGDYQSLPRGAKRFWTNLLQYNEHDVRGMKHLVEFILAHPREP